MTSSTDGSVSIQTSSESRHSVPDWFGEVVLLIGYLGQQGVLNKISEQVRFARRRFGQYEVIDFVAVLLGYAISGERRLEVFYEHLAPFGVAFMALFGRERLPSRSALSRFLAALSEVPVEALRTVFVDDLLSRPLSGDGQIGGLVDRAGETWLVFDIDGTRQAARQRALPQTNELPPACRRLDEACAPGYTGRKRGQVVRTRTVISQAHTFQWLGSFGNRGNGHYREELLKGLEAITCYLRAHQLPPVRALLRLDGEYGTGAVLVDLAGFTFVTRGKDYTTLDNALIQARLHLPADQGQQRPESQVVRNLFDCPDVPVGPQAQRCRVIVATHPAGPTQRQVGVERDGTVYELFFTNLPQQAFTARDVVELYLHRGAFEPILADEDQEQESDRWCSHAAVRWGHSQFSSWTVCRPHRRGQECWQVVSQWVWNLRLELGHRLHPSPVRTTEFAPTIAPPSAAPPHDPPAAGYTPPQVGSPWKAGRFSGQDFTLQPDGTLRCPANQQLVAHERRTEIDGSLRVVFGASLHSCRPCPLRAQCQWQGSATQKPRQVSLPLHPLAVGPGPLLWRDWSRRVHRRAVRLLLRQQHLEVRLLAEQPSQSCSAPAPPILSRAQRSPVRLSWAQRLMCNARAPTQPQVSIRLFGMPDHFAAFLGLPSA